MKKVFFIILAMALMVATPTFASTVEVQRARALGTKFVEANFNNTTSLEWVCTAVTESGRPSYHVFNATAGGFVIVSACDLTSPILGYAETGSFSTEDIPDGLAYFLDGYGQSVDYAEERLQKADFTIAQEWANLESCGKTKTEKSNVVQPLITTRWHQNCYYNASCPKDDNGPCERAYVGCVATSMGQVMKYWSYPEHGTGNHVYNCPPYGNLYVDFSQALYRWDEMPEALTAPHPDLALMLYHCGVSVNMMYSAYGSGAFQQDIPAALSSYFGYAPSQCLMREDYSHDEWTRIMREALDSEVPVLYAGQDGESGGHAFVCDGYDANGLFHFNWCWGGQYDGYFSIDNLQVGIQNWNVYQKMVANARPLPVYNETPKAPTNFTVEPLSDVSYSADIHWTNPNKTLNNGNLSHIDQIIVKRNGIVVYTQDNATPGATMHITDEVPHYGLYDYQVYAINNGIHGLIASQERVCFGPSCTWTVVAGTSSPNGWQGAAIQVINNASQVYGSVSATSSSATLQMDVPLGLVSFAWVMGNSAINDVTFTIKDAENQVVYSYSGPTADLPDGVFLQTNNSCGNATDCGMPIDLYAFAEGDYVVLDWFDSSEAENYNVYRDGTLLVTVLGQETGFVDEEPNYGGNCYYVTAFCEGGESDPTNEACVTIGDDCQPASNLWFEMTSNNKVKLTWDGPQPNVGLSGYYVYRTKETDMNWQKVKTLNASATSYTDNSILEDETFYLYKVVAYYQDIDCYSAPARSKYSEFEFFVRVYWSVDGVEEAEKICTEVFPVPGTDRMNVRTTYENATLQVFDILGHKMLELPLTDELTAVNTERWPSGMYFWKVNSNDEAECGKWVKK